MINDYPIKDKCMESSVKTEENVIFSCDECKHKKSNSHQDPCANCNMQSSRFEMRNDE